MKIPQSYNKLKKWLESECNIKHKDHPKQLLDLNGYPYWRCSNWEQLEDALSHCSVPKLGSIIFSSKEGLKIIEVYDDFITNNLDYRWDVLNSEDSEE